MLANRETGGKAAAARRKQFASLIAALLVLALMIGGILLFNRFTAGNSPTESPTFGGSQQPQHSGSTKKATAKPSVQQRKNPSRLPTVKASELPVEAQQTLALIARGGPYPYDRDGADFGNFEGVLPKQRSGYYQEYTVRTPAESDRGARRIIVGAQGEKYYTNDHYGTFRFIEEGQ